MSRVRRVLLAAAATVLVAIPLSVGSALATTITIWPDQFKIDRWEVDTGVPARQDPDTIMGNEHFYAVINVPVGAVIKFIRINYNNPDPVGSPLDFSVYLFRKSAAALAETLIDVSSPPLVEGRGSVQSNASHVKGPLTVKAGYRYFINVMPSEGPGSFNSIQVVY